MGVSGFIYMSDMLTLSLLPFATKLRRLCFYTCLSVILLTGGRCAIPACIAAGGVLSQHALQVVSQHALQQGGGGVLSQHALQWGVCSWGGLLQGWGGLLLGGACSRGVCSRKQTATVADLLECILVVICENLDLHTNLVTNSVVK